MKLIRTTAKINLVLSAVIYLCWIVYRLWSGLPIHEEHYPHSLSFGPEWLDNLVVEAFFIYLFFFDKRISELFVRVFGFISIGGLMIEVVISLVQSHTYVSPQSVPDPLYSWYVWPSIAVCALLGRKPLTSAEMERLRRVFESMTSRAG